jgi:hypothetical protein
MRIVQVPGLWFALMLAGLGAPLTAMAPAQQPACEARDDAGGSGDEAAPIRLEVIIGEPLENIRSRAEDGLVGPPGEGVLMARGPVDLRLGYGGRTMEFGRIEGGRQPLLITDSSGAGVVDGVALTYEPDLLPLDVAIARAQALKPWLELVGFTLPIAPDAGDIAAFTVIRADGSAGARAADWTRAARMLGDEARGITAMQLLTLRSSRHIASLRLENVRRHQRDVCAHSIWRGQQGQEWRLLFSISPSQEPAQLPSG